MSEPTDQLLLEQFLSTGSPQAFEHLVARHSGWVYALARRRVGSADMAEDITQATFIVLARKAHTLSKKPSIASWLYRVARYASIDALRRQSARVRSEKIAARPEVTMPPIAEDQAVEQHVNAALDRLPDRDREAILLRYFNDQTLEQIGHVQNVAASTVGRRIDRALAHMRHLLKQKGIAVSPAILAGVMAGIGHTAAPQAATASIRTLALASGSLPVSTAGSIGLAKGAINAMTLLKIKLATAAAIATLTVGTAGVLITQAIAQQTTSEQPAAGQVIHSFSPATPADNADNTTPAIQTEYAGDWMQVSISAAHNNPAIIKTADPQVSINITCRFDLGDVTHIIGFDRFRNNQVMRILNGEGKEVTAQILPASNANWVGSSFWFAPLSYDNNYDSARNQFVETLSPVEFTVKLPMVANSPDKLQQVQVQMPMFVCKTFRTVDIPYVAGGKPTVVTPDFQANFKYAEKNEQSFRYQLEKTMSEDRPSFNGQVDQKNPLPEQMICNKYLVNAKGESLQDRKHPFGSFPTPGSETGAGGIQNASKIAAMRFVVAEGLEIKMVTVTVNNVELPNMSTMLNAVPAK